MIHLYYRRAFYDECVQIQSVLLVRFCFPSLPFDVRSLSKGQVTKRVASEQYFQNVHMNQGQSFKVIVACQADFIKQAQVNCQ